MDIDLENWERKKVIRRCLKTSRLRPSKDETARPEGESAM